MINFISGRASSGKTYTVYNRIKNDVQNGTEVILVVPEQYSFESEKAILDLIGEKSINYVSVLPFSRIYETIGRIKGGICGKVLTNSDKHILMNRAIQSVSGELSLWGKYAHSSSFTSNIIRTIDEFKYEAVNSDDLRNTANGITDKKLQNKLNDTALIFDAFEAMLGTQFLDPSDYMDKLYLMLKTCDFFKDKSVYFDGFKSFSGQQFKVIDLIIKDALNVTFTFIDDKDDKREFSLLTNVRKIKSRISKIALNHNKNINEDLFLTEQKYKNKDLVLLENAMFYGKYSSDEKMKNITVCKAESIFDEAEFTARNIRKIIREENARFSDFVVIARDTKTYEDALSVAAKRNNVKCFIDKRIPLSSMPVSVAAISAIEFTKSKKIRNIFDFYKSGFDYFTTEEISTLESYSLIWNLKADDFNKVWDMNPSGLTERLSDDYDTEIKRLNDLRIKAITPLNKFSGEFNGTPKQRATAILNLLNSLGARKSYLKLNDYYKENGDFEYAEALKQSYTEFISLLESVVRCFPDVAVSKPIFFDAIKVSLSLNTVGVAPQTLDEAILGDADRIRPARPKYAFILGLNQGIFPKTHAPNGLFTNNDISKLKNSGLEIADKRFDLAIDEELLLYTNVCCASEKVFLSYTEKLPDLTDSYPSAFLQQIMEKFQVKTVKEPSKLCKDNLPETVNSAVIEHHKRFVSEKNDAKTIADALVLNGVISDNDLLNTDFTAKDIKLSPDIAKQLFGKEIYMSATKLDDFGGCKFKYFCKYIANAKTLQTADFNAMQRGTIIHYVLEKIVNEYHENIANLSPNQISDKVDSLCEEYLDGVKGFRTVENERTKLFVSIISRTLKYVVMRLANEFLQSKFKPVACELKIGKDCDIKINIPINNGSEIIVNGSVDRVDTYENYVRIIDYKSGGKVFKLPEILSGQNMQMLLYLFAVLKSGNYGDLPAGILYMTAKREMTDTRSKRKMDGLIVADQEVAEAMENENSGEFIPKFNIDKLSENYITKEEYDIVLNFVNKKLAEVGNELLDGNISAKPINGYKKNVCEYCDYKSVCRIDSKDVKQLEILTNAETIEKIKKGENIDVD